MILSYPLDWSRGFNRRRRSRVFVLLDAKNTDCRIVNSANNHSSCFFFLIVVQIQLFPFSSPPWPLPHPSPPPTLDPTPFGFVYVSFIHVPWWPFPYVPPLSFSPFPSGPCQFVLYFNVSSYILLACLFCWLCSTYRWDHMVFVFHSLTYFT